MGTRIFQKIKLIIRSLFSVIYGKSDTCLLCENPEENNYICKWCNEGIRILNLNYYVEREKIRFPCYSIGLYSLNLKKLILLLKYHREFVAAEILASYLVKFIEDNLKDKVEIITFIPSSKSSYKKRGFNQCEVICSYVSEKIKIPYKNLMDKASESLDQIGLDTHMRWQNMDNSFKLREVKLIENKRVLLIDDVFTSGATSFYGAKCLKDGGAKEVYILTVAKSGV